MFFCVYASVCLGVYASLSPQSHSKSRGSTSSAKMQSKAKDAPNTHSGLAQLVTHLSCTMLRKSRDLAPLPLNMLWVATVAELRRMKEAANLRLASPTGKTIYAIDGHSWRNRLWQFRAASQSHACVGQATTMHLLGCWASTDPGPCPLSYLVDSECPTRGLNLYKFLVSNLFSALTATILPNHTSVQ